MFTVSDYLLISLGSAVAQLMALPAPRPLPDEPLPDDVIDGEDSDIRFKMEGSGRFPGLIRDACDRTISETGDMSLKDETKLFLV